MTPKSITQPLETKYIGKTESIPPIETTSIQPPCKHTKLYLFSSGGRDLDDPPAWKIVCARCDKELESGDGWDEPNVELLKRIIHD